MELRGLRRSLMIVKPSIAFNDFAGTAKDVTARNVKGRNILSSRAQHSKIVTPAQAVSRNRLSKISRTFRQLSDSQINRWEVLAGHLKGISTFGQAAELTAHNAFVRINSNRAMVGMPPLTDAPAYINDVPEVLYDDLWISPDRLIFMNVQQPSDHHYLVVKMSPAQSPGVTNGWSKTVIVAPGVDVEYGDVDLTERYVDIKGFELKAGEKYFCEVWWLDAETGFTGESMWVSGICKEGSTGYDATYPRRALVEIKEEYQDSIRTYVSDLEVGFTKGSTLANAKFHYEWQNTRVNTYYEIYEYTEDMPNCTLVALGRGTKYRLNSVNLIGVSFRRYDGHLQMQIHPESQRRESYYDVFDTSAAFIEMED